MKLPVFSPKERTPDKVVTDLVSNINGLLSDLRMSKDKDIEDKISKRTLLSLLLNVATVVATSVNVHFGTRDILAQLTQTLKWVFYLALVALFKNEILSLIYAIFYWILQYIQYGQYIFKNLSFDQIFQVLYVSPVVIVITCLSQKDNRDNLVKSIKKILSKFN